MTTHLTDTSATRRRDCRRLWLAAMLVVAVTLLSACRRSGLLPTSGGRPYEVVVTGADREAVDSVAGLLRSVVAEGLPQRERAFDVTAVVADGLSQNTRYVRNLVAVTVADTVAVQGDRQHTRTRVATDVYAQPQTVVAIEAPSTAQLLADLPQLRQTLADELLRAEMNHAIAYLRDHHNDGASRLVDSLFGCRLWIPQDLTTVARGRDFLWACSDGATSMLAVCVYRVAADTLSALRLPDLRDSVLRTNIPCEPADAYVTTVRPSLTFRQQPDGTAAVVGMRGLWATEGTAMGGPFVCLARQTGDSLLVADAFVYAPSQPKRNLMRRLEASLYTLRVGPADQQP